MNSDVFSKNVQFFVEKELIDSSDQLVVIDINRYHNSFCKIIYQLFCDLQLIFPISKADGLIGIRNETIEYYPAKIPVICLFGGMAYRIISDFYSDEINHIEYYIPSSGDYDACMGIDQKLLYLGSQINADSNFIHITELFKYSVFKGSALFYDELQFRVFNTRNNYVCNNKLCDHVYMHKTVYDNMIRIFTLFLERLYNLFVSIGYKLFEENPIVIDKIFIKFAEYKHANKSIAIYIKPIVFMDKYVDAHFRVAIPAQGGQFYHLFELTVYENMAERNQFLGHVIRNEGNFKKIKLYHLKNKDYEMITLSPQCILPIQFKDIIDHSEKPKEINSIKCQKSYLRIRYLISLLHNYVDKLFIYDRNDIYNSIVYVENSIKDYQKSIEKCIRIRGLPIYLNKESNKDYRITNIYYDEPTEEIYSSFEKQFLEPDHFDPMDNFYSIYKN
jgi:hypothetical protein